jgi:D-alanyl-D-alanine dipeptidase
MRKIDPGSLIPMDLFEGCAPLRVDLAYAQPQPKSFCGVIYRPGARLWLHEDLALIVLRAAFRCHEAGYSMILYDGLRTTDAQALIRATPVVQANPHWLEGENRMLSPPGQGGHPRAMAVDIALEDAQGALLDMGTDFDALAQDSSPAHNRAHRLYEGLPPQVYKNRELLTGALVAAGEWAGRAIRPLPSEWWDFRFMNEDYNQFAPLGDAELPPQMRMTHAQLDAPGPADFSDVHFTKKRDELLSRCKRADSAG